MGDAPTANLEQLLRALAKQRSLRGRLRVLGHSWTLLRSLSPPQREQVALRLGSQWAWKRVEKAFLKDGELSENEQLVGRAFERMGGSDPGELRKLARMLREGDRAGAQDLLRMTLTEALEEEAEDGEAAKEEEELREAAGPEIESDQEPEAETGLPAVSDRLDRAEGVRASTRARAVQEPEPRPEPVAPRAFPAPAEPEPPREPIRLAPALPETPAPEPAVPRPAPAAPAADRPIEPAASTNGADRLRILRDLQRSERPGADLGCAGRAALLESLGGGWATRRALTRMIRARSLDGLDEALPLVEQLMRQGQQAWCLADLIAHWELDSAELDRILEAAPTDAARRRLAGRFLKYRGRAHARGDRG